MADELFDLDAVYAEERTKPFKFVWAGQQWELPAYGDLDWRAAGMQSEIVDAAGEDGQAEVQVDVLQRVFAFAFGSEQAERWEKATQPSTAMIRLFAEWQKRSGASAGESEASTDSSESTERPSKQTSTASTASGSAKPSTGRRRSG